MIANIHHRKTLTAALAAVVVFCIWLGKPSLVLAAGATRETGAATHAAVDVLVVVDNSGSMKRNDPKFLLRDVVSGFAQRLEEDSRLGLVVFDERVEMPLGLTRIDRAGFAEELKRALDRVNYRGQLTDTPAGFERAVYELRQQGGAEAVKLIVLLTDGLVDVGEPRKSLERQRWLEGELAQEAKRLGIRVFGIALSNEADFQLLQSLSQATQGQYYRLQSAVDIGGTFDKIFAEIQELTKKPEAKLLPEPPPAAVQAPIVPAQPIEPQQPEPMPRSQPPAAVPAPSVPAPPTEAQQPTPESSVRQAPQPEPASVGGLPSWLIWVVVGGAALIAVAALVALRSRKPAAPSSDQRPMPKANLIDLDGASGSAMLPINTPKVRIGRDDSTNDIVVPKDTVTSQHAVIEYRGGDFYLRDLRSTNGTFVNGKQISDPTESREVMLKHGDRIRFDVYEFEFAIEGMAAARKTQIAGAARKGTVVRGQPPAAVAEPMPAEAAVDEGEAAGTHVKPRHCPNHPEWSATEICQQCKGAFCKNCIAETPQGRRLCKDCLPKATAA